MTQNRLETDIKKHKKEIHSDSYPMSIGEVISMYRDNELDIHPEFQRIYRWTVAQKSKFIESILLGIPLPSFFVSQRDDGVWDVVDGLQRLSTIFEFMGELRKSDETPAPALMLDGTNLKYLKSLNNAKWSDDKLITPSIKLDFKRSKIDFKIIKKESSSDAKYELFQRLNAGGTELSDQEIRNCLLIMVNNDFYKWLHDLAQNEDFQQCIALSEDQKKRAYDLELVTRFIVYLNCDWKSKPRIGDIGNFLDDQIVGCAKNTSFDTKATQRRFLDTFSRINEAAGEDAFKKYDAIKKRNIGAFSIALYESITIGIASNLKLYRQSDQNASLQLQEKIRHISEQKEIQKNSGSGVTASTRVSNLIPYGICYFGDKS